MEDRQFFPTSRNETNRNRFHLFISRPCLNASPIGNEGFFYDFPFLKLSSRHNKNFYFLILLGLLLCLPACSLCCLREKDFFCVISKTNIGGRLYYPSFFLCSVNIFFLHEKAGKEARAVEWRKVHC